MTVFIHMEHELDLHHAARLSINLDDMLLVKPKTGEQAFEVIEALIRLAPSHQTAEFDIIFKAEGFS